MFPVHVNLSVHTEMFPRMFLNQNQRNGIYQYYCYKLWNVVEYSKTSVKYSKNHCQTINTVIYKFGYYLDIFVYIWILFYSVIVCLL